MDKIRPGLVLYDGIPKAVNVGRSIKAVPQVNWPLRLCNCRIESLFVRRVEKDAAIGSIPAIDLLKAGSFKNRQDQYTAQNHGFGRSRDSSPRCRGLDRIVRSCFFAAEEPFQCRDGQEQKKYWQRK